MRIQSWVQIIIDIQFNATSFLQDNKWGDHIVIFPYCSQNPNIEQKWELSFDWKKNATKARLKHKNIQISLSVEKTTKGCFKIFQQSERCGFWFFKEVHQLQLRIQAKNFVGRMNWRAKMGRDVLTTPLGCVTTYKIVTTTLMKKPSFVTREQDAVCTGSSSWSTFLESTRA